MQSNKRDETSAVSSEQTKAFQTRILGNSMLHLMDEPMDPLHVRRFQSLGLIRELESQSLPEGAIEVLLNPAHAMRVSVPSGPFVFVRHDAHISAVEVAPMLLSGNQEVRDAALQYFEGTRRSCDPIVAPHVLDLLASRSADIRSDELVRWRTASIELVPVLRDDLLGHIAGLRQSWTARYADGFDQYAQLVMRPSLNSLARVAIPVWSASEQRADIETRIGEWAALPALDAALTGYYNHCGYLPLCTELGAGELAARWVDQHPGARVSWQDVWSWATKRGTPYGKYHALTIALRLPSARPADSSNAMWDEITKLFSSALQRDADEHPQSVWALYSELARHFATHIETVVPGRDGDRVACYAWWLAEKVGRIFGETDKAANRALEEIVRPEAAFSISRWSIARSPVTPSAFRHVTLFSRSTWAIALAVHLNATGQSLNPEQMPQGCREKLGSIIGGYSVSIPPSEDSEGADAVYAVGEKSEVADLLKDDGAILPEGREAIHALIVLRQGVQDATGFKMQLERLRELDEGEQRATLLLLRAVTFSTKRYDDAISEWLDQTSQVVEALRTLPEPALQSLIEALGEFQQRPRVDWPIRLPHVMAYTLEQTDDLDRFAFLYIHTLLMSINGGIASPIQRVMTSKWRAEALPRLRIWRENIIEAAKYSEPWVAARVRATAAAISRLIGPRIIADEPAGEPAPESGDL